ncbi:MAG: ferredoxin family protein [Candidatus Hodarchaeota archaeon]|jgi:NAD-dependent dihydropyrimidine dehydrogenase PreA subunit
MTNLKRWEDNNHWVEIDLDSCMASGECVAVCPSEVYEIIDGKVNAENIAECIECGACQDTCPYYAILSHAAWR